MGGFLCIKEKVFVLKKFHTLRIFFDFRDSLYSIDFRKWTDLHGNRVYYLPAGRSEFKEVSASYVYHAMEILDIQTLLSEADEWYEDIFFNIFPNEFSTAWEAYCKIKEESHAFLYSM
jgi:hypothetical protein